jgi:lysophospholipase L1-like esterase
MTDRPPFIHDRLLGYVPNPGFCGPGFGTSFHTIDANGLRWTGEGPASGEGAILAVGDSYTYGDEVRDEESWPAQLQRLTGRRVLNGGVTGYGFDQIVLRTEQLAAACRPSLIIVSFIADDISRTEMRCLWWRNKPWFAIEDDRLVLKGVPVPDRPRLTHRLPPRLRLLTERVLLELPWIVQRAVGYHVRVHPAGFGRSVAQRLIERLARLQSEHPVRVILMAQYTPHFWQHKEVADGQRRLTQAILDRAATCGLAIQDTFQRLAVEPRPLAYYGHAHLNARGNLMIASLLAARLPALAEARPAIAEALPT